MKLSKIEPRMCQMVCLRSKRRPLAERVHLQQSFACGLIGFRNAFSTPSDRLGGLWLTPQQVSLNSLPSPASAHVLNAERDSLTRPTRAHFSISSVSFGHGLLPLQEKCVILPILGVFYDITFTSLPLNSRSLF